MHFWQARKAALGGLPETGAAVPAPEAPRRPRLRMLQPPERLAAMLAQCIQAMEALHAAEGAARRRTARQHGADAQRSLGHNQG